MSEETPKDFNELVAWATWQVIQGITAGQPLRSVMHGVLVSAIEIKAGWEQA